MILDFMWTFNGVLDAVVLGLLLIAGLICGVIMIYYKLKNKWKSKI